jgi:hypothetical protein
MFGGHGMRQVAIPYEHNNNNNDNNNNNNNTESTNVKVQ